MMRSNHATESKLSIREAIDTKDPKKLDRALEAWLHRKDEQDQYEQFEDQQRSYFS